VAAEALVEETAPGSSGNRRAVAGQQVCAFSGQSAWAAPEARQVPRGAGGEESGGAGLAAIAVRCRF
jgi:hypothetical protein